MVKHKLNLSITFLIFCLFFPKILASDAICFPIDRISFLSLNSYLYKSDSEIELINRHFPFKIL
ncbi:hypothetical protein DCO58_00730 [Helicobacter saguini]|uniref:Uncharacterized protein n=1 Tax=Helicobacter saguini TaxID=1548018 RepID=A0A347VR07_9HELI|nr:hypothetical protein [Helicobacter saguini]MWV63085.1 hypothetical protein [Helicobacter saguini]MWV66245.1 hypothetical protein [Helicobacter saguini]MWV68598.1 hypothetical protein [Helicobacter saguini]MWV71851.1 hypothetical protein [Helicobacter saguini]TLD95870.1 hypothetical protein LS64_000440 [Helicobacter saguini]